MSFGPEHRSTFAESITRMIQQPSDDEEPIAYKYLGKTDTWLCTEYENDDLGIMQPVYAPIEDEL